LLFSGEHIRGGDAVRHTFLDGIFDVMCSVVALKIVHAHPLSRSIFNVIAILLISEAHSGYDFPWSAHNVFPFFAGPVLHRQHHKKGSSNFGKFFIWCDYCCGTLSYDI
jgi:sterol desaturase/sphingolipid hydroxylase (fatty acid hydroxylase superfamily)